MTDKQTSERGETARKDEWRGKRCAWDKWTSKNKRLQQEACLITTSILSAHLANVRQSFMASNPAAGEVDTSRRHSRPFHFAGTQDVPEGPGFAVDVAGLAGSVVH